MSYCVNCGVELDASATRCPLCATPVINPAQTNEGAKEVPFPTQKGAVEMPNRHDAAILLTAFALATAGTCALLNLLSFRGMLWSLAVIGACVVLWVFLFPVMMWRGLSVYGALFLDGISVAVYLYLIALMIDRYQWFYDLGLPIAALTMLMAIVFSVFVKKLSHSFLAVSLYIVTMIGLFCVGLEMLIDHFLGDPILLSWSAVVLTVCVILDILLITMLSRKRLRSAVRRRLHF